MPDLAEPPFRWENLDQRLLSPKLQEVAEEMQRRSAEAERKAAYDTQQSGNWAGYLPRLFNAQKELVDEWAKRIYAVHTEVWAIQGHSISAAFIRAVSSRAIRQLIVARKGAVASSAESWCTRTGRTQLTAGGLRHWNRSVDALAAKWARNLEVEAVSTEYRSARGVFQSPGQQVAERRLARSMEEGMRYPSDFPKESRARVETEKIRAGREFDLAKQSCQWRSQVEAHLRQYILKILLAFAKEAQTQRLWPVDRMDSECRDFLRLLTIQAECEKGYDISGGRLPDMISKWTGSILSEVQRAFEKMPEWTQYQDSLLEVAEPEIGRGRQIARKSTKFHETIIGRNIDRLRRDCGWSFNKLSDQTGIDKKLILGHVNGGKGIRPSTLKLYADAFTKGLKRPVLVAELES